MLSWLIMAIRSEPAPAHQLRFWISFFQKLTLGLDPIVHFMAPFLSASEIKIVSPASNFLMVRLKCGVATESFRRIDVSSLSLSVIYHHVHRLSFRSFLLVTRTC